MTQLVDRLPPLPLVCQRVLALAEDSDTGARDLAAVVAGDVRMSLETIRVANSAYFARREPAVSVADAVVTIGIDNARHIALGVALLSAFRGVSDDLDQKDLLHLGMSVARHWRPLGDHAATAGILQHAGLLAMATAHEQFHAYAAAAPATSDYESLHRLERELFGGTRCDLTCAVAEYWKLPRSVVDILRSWHLCGAARSALYLPYVDAASTVASPLLQAVTRR